MERAIEWPLGLCNYCVNSGRAACDECAFDGDYGQFEFCWGNEALDPEEAMLPATGRGYLLSLMSQLLDHTRYARPAELSLPDEIAW
jgi:hypothetical protein